MNLNKFKKIFLLPILSFLLLANSPAPVYYTEIIEDYTEFKILEARKDDYGYYFTIKNNGGYFINDYYNDSYLTFKDSTGSLYSFYPASIYDHIIAPFQKGEYYSKSAWIDDNYFSNDYLNLNLDELDLDKLTDFSFSSAYFYPLYTYKEEEIEYTLDIKYIKTDIIDSTNIDISFNNLLEANLPSSKSFMYLSFTLNYTLDEAKTKDVLISYNSSFDTSINLDGEAKDINIDKDSIRVYLSSYSYSNYNDNSYIFIIGVFIVILIFALMFVFFILSIVFIVLAITKRKV